MLDEPKRGRQYNNKVVRAAVGPAAGIVPLMDASENRLFDTLAAQVGAALSRRGWMLVTAESCTGGWVAQSITAVAGSSAWFERGFVTYSNAAKQELLGVPAQTLARVGAVSERTAIEMAEGALRASRADVSVAITGIAGPGGGTPDKPVGTVCFACQSKDGARTSTTQHFSGDRRQVRAQSVAYALQAVLNHLAEPHR